MTDLDILLKLARARLANSTYEAKTAYYENSRLRAAGAERAYKWIIARLEVIEAKARREKEIERA